MSTATIPKAKARQLLQSALDAIPELQKLPHGSDQFAKWKRNTRVAIERIFSDEKHLKEFNAISYHPPPIMAVAAGPNIRPTPSRDITPYYQRGLKEASVILESMIGEIDTFWDDEPATVEFWHLIHPKIVEVTKGRFEAGNYADCAESALKQINCIVKDKVKRKTGQEYDGADLMNRAFSINNPIIVLDDLSADSGKDIQKGYMQIFAGAMTGIRNPKAHQLIIISRERAIHFIFFTSLLMYTLDMAEA